MEEQVNVRSGTSDLFRRTIEELQSQWRYLERHYPLPDGYRWSFAGPENYRLVIVREKRNETET